MKIGKTMPFYSHQVQDIMRLISELVPEFGEPHTISVMAHFDDRFVSYDVRIADAEEEVEAVESSEAGA